MSTKPLFSWRNLGKRGFTVEGRTTFLGGSSHLVTTLILPLINESPHKYSFGVLHDDIDNDNDDDDDDDDDDEDEAEDE